ncbi:nucleoside recognition domain-containing protein [Nitratifractor sp.]
MLRQSLRSALSSVWIVIKLVIPISILADVLQYSGWLAKVAFLFEPFTAILGLPPEATLSILAGVGLNLYAAVAFAAPLSMSPEQWTVLAIFLGICHSLPVENAVMKRLGISMRYSYILRLGAGLGIAAIVAHSGLAGGTAVGKTAIPELPHYVSWREMLGASLSHALSLALKIALLVSLLILLMDGIKALPFLREIRHLGRGFTLTVGVILGITYGAGILIREREQGALGRGDLLFIGTFLMICHAIIEDTMLFVLFGADWRVVVAVRTVAALLLALGAVGFLRSMNSRRGIGSNDIMK